MRIQNILCHSFAPDYLRNAKIAFDCGSNHGEFARWLSDNTKAQVYSFEPDTRLFGKLPKLPRVSYYPIAIDGESGEFDLALGDNNCSSALYRERRDQPTVRVSKTSLDDFCHAHHIEQIDFIKVDIEGAELSLLERTSDSILRVTGQLTVEFHDFLNKEDVPRIVKIFKRMRNLGFFCVRFSQFTWGDCLFLNEQLIPVSLLDKFSTHFSGRIIPGLARLTKRKIRDVRRR